MRNAFLSIALATIAHLAVFAGSVKVIKQNRLYAAASGDSSDMVFIEGDIDGTLVKEFIREVERQRVGACTVYINSPGGSLFAGMQLGQEIRKRAFDTDVGQYAKGKSWGTDPGVCYSAAVLTFLGGRYRWCQKGSKIGVHRFFSNEQAVQSMDLAQVISAAIVNYLKDMGIDPSLMDRMARAGRDDVLILSVPDMRGLLVTNDGVLPAKWSIEIVHSRIYLKGEQESSHGMGKLLFYLLPGKGLHILAMYEVGPNPDFITINRRLSLRVDGEFLPIEQVTSTPSWANGFASVSFMPTPAQIERLKVAREVGFAFHPPNLALFTGFTISVTEPRNKYLDFIQYCVQNDPRD